MPLVTCPACGNAFDDAHASACPSCGAPVTTPTTTPPPADETTVGSSVPFEDSSKPFLSRLLETVGLAFSNPKQLFSNLPSENIGPPVLYWLIVGTVTMWVSLVWQAVFGSMLGLSGVLSPEEFAIDAGFRMVFAILGPLLILVGLFISSGIYHVMLLLLGDGSRGFGVTLRAVSYGSTPGLLGVVPFCGGIIGGIWGMVLTIMAASYGHRTEGWRAIVAYFLPLVLCCGLIFFLVMLFGMAGAALAS